jgi:hypothetical protein
MSKIGRNIIRGLKQAIRRGKKSKYNYEKWNKKDIVYVEFTPNITASSDFGVTKIKEWDIKSK